MNGQRAATMNPVQAVPHPSGGEEVTASLGLGRSTRRSTVAFSINSQAAPHKIRNPRPPPTLSPSAQQPYRPLHYYVSWLF